jgi:hypothetical protein
MAVYFATSFALCALRVGSQSGYIGTAKELDLFFIDPQRSVSADALVIEQKSQVDQGHGSWDERVDTKCFTIPLFAGGDQFLLGFGSLVLFDSASFFYGFTVQAVDGGGTDIQEGTWVFGFVLFSHLCVDFSHRFACESVFNVSQTWTTDQASGEHTDTAHDRHRNSTGFWLAVADDSEHGWPEEGFPDGIDTECKEGDGEGCHIA